MAQTAIDFRTSNRLTLVGILTTPEDGEGPFPALVVCHPHPTLGGNMEHPLVTAICRTAAGRGIASLRFDFRGVGESQGSFTNGVAEQDDLRAAFEITRLLPRIDRKRLALVGYSFGASVVLGGLQRCRAARGVALICPPLSSVRNSWIRKSKWPKLFVVGERDRVVDPVELQRALDDVRSPVQFIEVPDADHGLVTHEQVVAGHVSEFLLRTLGA